MWQILVSPRARLGGNLVYAMKERFTARIPIGRMGKPEEITVTPVFQASEESSSMMAALRPCKRFFYHGTSTGRRAGLQIALVETVEGGG